MRVFRNEDTGWGWPFYFKFNAADVQAKAKSMEFEKRLAIITSYGWPSVFLLFGALPIIWFPMWWAAGLKPRRQRRRGGAGVAGR